MSPEERAKIARENGAKSNGPVTGEGKLHSSRNAIVDGKQAKALKFWVPPHSACTDNESRQAFYDLLDSLVEHYAPLTTVTHNIVREIALATWQIDRHTATQTKLFNREIFGEAHGPGPDPLLPATEKLIGPSRTVVQLTREIDRLHRRIAQLEKRFLLNRMRFSTRNKRVLTLAKREREEQTAQERTQLFPPQTIENMENGPENAKN